MPRKRIGIWFIGARGGVASTTIVGLCALKRGLIGTTGLVSELPHFAPLKLAGWDDFVIGGHDIRDVRLFDEALRMHTESRAIDGELIKNLKSDLEKIDKRIKPGTVLNSGDTIRNLAAESVKKKVEHPQEVVARVEEDLASFAKQEKLDHVVVVNIASTEPALDVSAFPAKWKDFEKQLSKKQPANAKGGISPPSSTLYAIAALKLGMSYVNFTPSTGSALPALMELAVDRGTRHMGHDGKTGETLLKSVLAPMFSRRNLNVKSWVGHNIFGNMDGRVLDDPVNKKAKVVSKDRLLGKILGYQPQTLVSIEFIESMGDWKTAWDHIHFSGFLGTPMTFQFIWQGCDSLLAAPLVIDLVRFTERAWRNQDNGLLTFLCSFFKSPLGTQEHDFQRQFDMLLNWASQIS